MITDEMLCVAAAESSAAYVRYLEQDYDPEHQHKLSKRFERKIKRLFRRVNHPFLYRSLQRIASIFLAILIGGAIWLTVDFDARATFFGWVKELYETYIVYKFETDSTYNSFAEEYRPTWLPDGYKETSVNVFNDTVAISYLNEENQGLVFCYASSYKKASWFVDQSVSAAKQVYVNETTADFLCPEDPEIANTIVWTASDNTFFYISAFLSEADMIKIAESVQKNK